MSCEGKQRLVVASDNVSPLHFDYSEYERVRFMAANPQTDLTRKTDTNWPVIQDVTDRAGEW